MSEECLTKAEYARRGKLMLTSFNDELKELWEALGVRPGLRREGLPDILANVDDLLDGMMSEETMNRDAVMANIDAANSDINEVYVGS